MFKNTFCTGWDLKSAHKPATVGVNTKLTYEPESLLGPPARNKMSSKNTSKEIYQNVIIKTIINVIKTIIISDCRPSSIFLISVIDYMLCWWTNYNNNNNNNIDDDGDVTLLTGTTWTVLTDCMMSQCSDSCEQKHQNLRLFWSKEDQTCSEEQFEYCCNIGFTATWLDLSHAESSSCSRRPPSYRQQQFIWCFSVWRLKSPTTNHNVLDSNLAADLAPFTSCLLSWRCSQNLNRRRLL